jgi:hypothetical protein
VTPDQHPLDALLDETMSGILTKVEAAFDPHERLAHLVGRTAGPTEPVAPADGTEHADGR